MVVFYGNIAPALYRSNYSWGFQEPRHWPGKVGVKGRRSKEERIRAKGRPVCEQGYANVALMLRCAGAQKGPRLGDRGLV